MSFWPTEDTPGESSLHRRGAVKVRPASAMLASTRPLSVPSNLSLSHRLSVGSASSALSMANSTTSTAEYSLPNTPEVAAMQLDSAELSPSSSRPKLCVVTDFDAPVRSTPLLESAEVVQALDAYAEPRPLFPTTVELQAKPSILVRRGYTMRRHTIASPSSPATFELEVYDAEVVRETRMKMAEELLARRKAARKAGRGGDKSTDGYLDSYWERQGETQDEDKLRVERFEAWEQREALALANERRWKKDVERSQGFMTWEREQRSRKARSWIDSGGAKISSF